jgi:hypothetical protein
MNAPNNALDLTGDPRRATGKYPLPECLANRVTAAAYRRWLHRKAMAHVRRDRGRGAKSASVADYKSAIHRAVIFNGGADAYTGEQLDWALISRYDNEESKIQRRGYKHKFGLLPTVDHLGDGTGPASFKICAWRTNDAKNDLPLSEFISLCQRVLEHQGFVVTMPTNRVVDSDAPQERPRELHHGR